MARDKGTHWVVTANRLDDGATVYCSKRQEWVESLSDALTTVDDSEKDALLIGAATQERHVCDPYAFRVVLGEHGPIATTARERIRSSGPTTPIRRDDAPTA